MAALKVTIGASSFSTRVKFRASLDLLDGLFLCFFYGLVGGKPIYYANFGVSCLESKATECHLLPKDGFTSISSLFFSFGADLLYLLELFGSFIMHSLNEGLAAKTPV